jgi:hypothetical protein
MTAMPRRQYFSRLFSTENNLTRILREILRKIDFPRKKVVEKNSLRGSDFFQVTPEELKALISKYGDTDKLAQSGVTIAGTRYMYLSSTDRVVRAKKGTNGVHAIKTQQSK